MDTPKKRKNTTKAERFERFSHRLCRKRHKKRDNARAAKKATRKISLAFSLQSSPEFLSVAFGRYESSLINLFLLQEESFHDERRREKGKFRLYYISSRRRRIVFLVFVGEF